MALTSANIMPRMVSGAGPIVANTWNGDGATTIYYPGMLLKKTSSGTVEPAVEALGIHAIYAGPLTSAATSAKVVIREITENTRFLCQLDSATNAAQAHIGDQYGINIASGVWSVDLTDTTAPDVEVTNIWDNSFDYDSSANESGNYGFIEVKVMKSNIDIAPTTQVAS